MTALHPIVAFLDLRTHPRISCTHLPESAMLCQTSAASFNVSRCALCSVLTSLNRGHAAQKHPQTLLRRLSSAVVTEQVGRGRRFWQGLA